MGNISAAPSVEETNETWLPSALAYLSREQKLAIEIILAGKATWTVALRKILVIVLSQQVLAESCAKGRTNASSYPLDPQKLNTVKGISYTVVANNFNIKITELIFKSFPGEKIQEGAMNVVVNSACSGAQRAMPRQPLV